MEPTDRSARDHRYTTSEKGRARHQTYNRTDNGQLRRQRYELLHEDERRYVQWRVRSIASIHGAGERLAALEDDLFEGREPSAILTRAREFDIPDHRRPIETLTAIGVHSA
jgi:hypothetical protein